MSPGDERRDYDHAALLREKTPESRKFYERSRAVDHPDDE